jgi:hypothetical protein
MCGLDAVTLARSSFSSALSQKLDAGMPPCAQCADNGCNGRFVIEYHGGGNVTMSTLASTCCESVVGVRPAAK